MTLKRKLPPVFLFILLGLAASAQFFTPVSIKGSKTTGTLQNMTGAQTVVGPFATTATGMLPIGFNFTLLDSTYDSVSISTSGFFRLGSKTAVQTAQNVGVNTNLPMIAPFWVDQNTHSTKGYIKILTTGTAPYRKFTVEWYCTSNAGATTYQASLFETTNRIQFDYNFAGSMNGGYTVCVQGHLGSKTNFVLWDNNNSKFLYNQGVSPYNYTNINAGTRLIFQPDTIIPVAPAGLAYSATAACVDLSWVDSSKNESYFVIQRSLDGIHYSPLAYVTSTTDTGRGTTYYYGDQMLSPQTNYYYTIQAGSGARSSIPVALNTQTTPPQLSGVKHIPADYPSIAAAMTDISCRWLAGNLVLELDTNYVPTLESNPLTLINKYNPSATTQLTIRPSALVTDTLMLYSLNLDSISYVNVDGRPGGTGTNGYLYLNGQSATATVVIYNNTEHCSFNYCTLNSKNKNFAGGVLNFNRPDKADLPCNYNTIRNCNIIGSLYMINSWSNGKNPNTADTIENNNFIGTSGTGIYLGNNNSNWLIRGNSFFGGPIVYPQNGICDIKFNDSVGGDHIVYGNYFGGTQPQCGGAISNVGDRYNSLYSVVAANKSVWFDGNQFLNLQAGGTLVEADRGNFYAGTRSPNLFGDSTGARPLGWPPYLINCNVSGPFEIKICNNLVPAMQVKNTTLFNVSGAANKDITIRNNQIGSNSAAGGITITTPFNALKVTTTAAMVGKVFIDSNSIQKVSAPGGATLAAINANLANSTQCFIQYNNIEHLRSTLTGNASGTNYAQLGITVIGSPRLSYIGHNTLRDMRLNSPGTNSFNVGIYTQYTTSGYSLIEKNLVSQLYNNASGSNWVQQGSSGIRLSAGDVCTNNMIQLGIDSAGDNINYKQVQFGIVGGKKVAFNSIYIGKQLYNDPENFAGAASTSFTNNIAINLRDSTQTLEYINTSDYNCYYYGSHTPNGSDNHSMTYTDPIFVNADGAYGAEDLRLMPGTPVGGKGLYDSTVYDDFDGNIRPLNPTIGASEADPVLSSTDIVAPLIMYTPMADTIYPVQHVLYASISDTSGLAVSGPYSPLLYFKRGINSKYVSSYGQLLSGGSRNGSWQFNFDSALVNSFAPGDTVYYFVVAQDNSFNRNIGSNANGFEGPNVFTPVQYPGAPRYFILQPYIDTLPPLITYDLLPDTVRVSTYSLITRIASPFGIATNGNMFPNVYRKVNMSGTPTGIQGSLISGNYQDGVYRLSVTSGTGKVGDTIYYFAAAATHNDIVGSNPPGVARNAQVYNIQNYQMPPVWNRFRIIDRPYVKLSPADTGLCIGQSLTFTTSIALGGSNPVYQWYKNSQPVGSNTSTYTDNNLMNGDSIWCTIVSNSTATGMTTNTAISNISIVKVSAPPVVALAPAGTINICQPDTIILHSTSDPTWKYSWYLNGNIYAGNTDSIRVSIPGIYTVRAGIPGCQLISAPDTVNAIVRKDTVLASGPLSFCSYDSIVLSSSLNGSGYRWSSGDTTPTITVKAGGHYSVTVSGGSPCPAKSDTVLVVVNPAPVANILIDNSNTAGADTVCAGQVQLSVAIQVGYQYRWNTGAVTNTITADSSGVYSVSVTNTYACTTSKTEDLILKKPITPTVSITASNQLVCKGTIVTFSASTTNAGNRPHFNWFNNGLANGIDSSSITIAASGHDSVWVQLATIAECISTDTVTSYGISVTTVMPAPQELCAVTIDTLSFKNIVVWEKENNYSTDSFYIYRATTPDTVYQLIAATNRDSLSVYEDTSSFANQVSYRYKINTKDTCGNFSTVSAYHQTIYLEYTGLGNFHWTSYEIENNTDPVSGYGLYRDVTGSGNWQLLTSMPATQYSVNIPDFGSYPQARYKVEAALNISCNPSRALQYVTSNILSFLVTELNDNTGAEIKLLFNPVHNYAQVLANTQPIAFRIYDYMGREMPLLVNKGNSTFTFDVSAYPSGIYYLDVVFANRRVPFKLIKLN